MGSYNRHNMINPPCTNCGKEYGGFMGSTSWEHNYYCCSNVCGFRLKKRIENGMYPEGYIDYHSNKEREYSLRIRIKQLEHKIKEG